MKLLHYFIALLTICFTSFNSVAQTDCLNFTNLSGSNVTCRYGDFYNPDLNIGIINGRHTVMSDTSQHDIWTNYQLKIVPPGERYSIRLGNSSANAQAESITYRIVVDTANFNLLFLKYAVVLENPSHTKDDQPRFKLEIFDTSNKLISPQCGSADFYSGFGGDWLIPNNVGKTINWKNWTITGFDLTPFQGQTIFVKLTTFDCELGGHFGYAYFNLQCGRKKIEKLGCNNNDSVSLQAPLGYKYAWYKSGAPSNIISSKRDIKVNIDGSTYYCECSALHNENCKFIISSKAKNIYPIPKFSYSSNCYNSKYKVQFRNYSFPSDDGIHPNPPPDSCDAYKWEFHNGVISTVKNPTFIYNKPGKFPVKLSAYIGQFCLNTLVDTIVIKDEAVRSNLQATICYEDRYSFANKWYNKTGIYTDTLRLINGCDSIVYLNLTVRPKVETHLQATFCFEDTYNFNGRTLNSTGIYRDTLQNKIGCDSIVILNLTKLSKIEKILSENICYGDTFKIANNSFDKSGTYTVVVKSKITGCDSTVILNLNVYDKIKFNTNIKHYVSANKKGSIEITNAPSNFTYSINGVKNGALTNLETGVYQVKVFDFRGCGSESQKITIMDCPQVNVQSPSICGDDKFFNVATEVKKGNPTSYSVIFDNIAKQYGFVDVLNKSFTSNTISVSVPNKITPNKYNAEIIFYNSLCESEKYGILIEISYPSSVLAQKWNDVIALLNKDYNGGYEFTAYQWYKNNEPIIGENSPHIYVLPSLEFGASYKLKLMRTDGIELFTCPIIAKPRNDVTVYPTSVRYGEKIRIKSSSTSKISIRNSKGILINTINQHLEEQLVPMPYVPGVYIIEIRFDNGNIETVKIIVYK